MSNRGKIWTVDELNILTARIKGGEKPEDVAAAMERTPGAITARVGMLMQTEITSGKTAAVVAREWNITEENVAAFIAKYDTILRNRPAYKLAELTEIVYILAQIVMEPESVSAEVKKEINARVSMITSRKRPEVTA